MRYWVQFHYGSEYEGKGYTVFADCGRALKFIKDYQNSTILHDGSIIATGVSIEDRTEDYTIFIPLLIHERHSLKVPSKK
jgi:hypothetical protein